jgi:hypothetical protein
LRAGARRGADQSSRQHGHSWPGPSWYGRCRWRAGCRARWREHQPRKCWLAWSSASPTTMPENGFCVLRAKARGHRDLVTVVGHGAARPPVTQKGVRASPTREVPNAPGGPHRAALWPLVREVHLGQRRLFQAPAETHADMRVASCWRRAYHLERPRQAILIALAALPGATLPRLRALALFGRRPPHRVVRPSSRRPKTCTEPDISQPHHSITSSARASSVGGTSVPSVLAVCKLMTNSNLVGLRTGRSAGLSPLRIRPV